MKSTCWYVCAIIEFGRYTSDDLTLQVNLKGERKNTIGLEMQSRKSLIKIEELYCHQPLFIKWKKLTSWGLRSGCNISTNFQLTPLLYGGIWRLWPLICSSRRFGGRWRMIPLRASHKKWHTKIIFQVP